MPQTSLGISLNEFSFVLLDEPVLGIFFGNQLSVAHSGEAPLSFGHSVSGPGEDTVEVHSEDTGVWIISDSQVNVLSDSEPKVTCPSKTL
jgi:hypothetical protein